MIPSKIDIKFYIRKTIASFRIWLARKILGADVIVIGATLENVRFECERNKSYVFAHNTLSGDFNSNGRIY